MCSKYKDYLRHPATFAFFNGITLPEDSFSDHFPCKTNYRGFFSPIKKSQPAIHSYQLLIAGLDHKNKHYECIKNLVSTKTSCDTFSARQSKRKHSAISPPPDCARVSAIVENSCNSQKSFSANVTSNTSDLVEVRHA